MVSVSAKKVFKKISCLCTFKACTCRNFILDFLNKKIDKIVKAIRATLKSTFDLAMHAVGKKR
jgi:hypothetical protein